MLTEKELKNYLAFQKLGTLGLDSTDYVIFGSGTMFALEIRPLDDLDDLDILVKSEVFEKLKSRGELKKSAFGDPVIRFEDGLIEVFANWQPNPHIYTFENLHKNSFKIGNYTFANIEDVLRWKKDKLHIKMIEEYLRHYEHLNRYHNRELKH